MTSNYFRIVARRGYRIGSLHALRSHILREVPIVGDGLGGLIDNASDLKSIRAVELQVQLWQLELPRHLGGIEVSCRYGKLVVCALVFYDHIFAPALVFGQGSVWLLDRRHRVSLLIDRIFALVSAPDSGL